MKKHYNLLILFLLIPFLGFSNDDNYISKQKTIKKTYIVNSNAGIDITNKYGNITVSTWDEDKIDLEITIKVTGGNENWVNERLNSIDVDITALKSLVSAVTNLGSSSLKSKGSSNSFEINYVIKIPKNGSVKIDNKYGNITTLNLESTTDISCKYGKVNLGKLNGSSNTIQIAYCQNSNIDYIKNSNIEARYSGLKINESGNINLDASYSDLTVGDSQNIKYDCNYGTFKFQKVNSFSGSGNYLTIQISELSSNLTSDITYSKLSVGVINEKAGNVNINSSYSDVSLGYSSNYAFDFDIATRYGSIKAGEDLETSVSESKSSSKNISGYHKKKGQNKIQVTSSYGNVSLIKK
ncbi:hypothetical protein [Flavobacterium pectinovorum]|uniref:Adhesin domain-containing protein n=1 Tax=Flavobacterium pectinovorum TaxID=29533 RepID=A0A502EME9_9FLAO|nr:hypothetical protein [Flavobacterium pectinovorum]TPG37666.1 hypothetical protein EAH81_19455 [Flavobacterium pectinovorum]